MSYSHIPFPGLGPVKPHFLPLIALSLIVPLRCILAEETVLLYDYYSVDVSSLHIKKASLMDGDFVNPEKTHKFLQDLSSEKVALHLSGSCRVDGDQIITASTRQNGGEVHLMANVHLDKMASALSILEINFSIAKLNSLPDYRHSQKYENYRIFPNGRAYLFSGIGADNASGEATNIRLMCLELQIRK